MTIDNSIDLPVTSVGPTGPSGPSGPPGPIRFSPAFKFSRQGVSGVDTWLLADGIPSNLVGQSIGYANAEISSVDIDSSEISTYDVSFYQYDHVTYTFLLTVSVIADYGVHASASIPITQGTSISARVTSGSGTNISVGLVVSQT